jgi:hypothetical protein
MVRTSWLLDNFAADNGAVLVVHQLGGVRDFAPEIPLGLDGVSACIILHFCWCIRWRSGQLIHFGSSRINVKARQNSQAVIPDLIRNPASLNPLAVLDSGYKHAGMTVVAY